MAENLKTLNGYGFNAAMLDGKTFSEIMLSMYPVGSIYLSVDSTSPASLFGGTWQQIQDCFLLAAGGNYDALSYGGEAEHTLTQPELPNYDIGSIPMIVPTNHTNWNNGGILGTNVGYASSSKPGISNLSNNGITSGLQYGYKVESNGGNKAHNNMPPYLAVYMWVRVS